MPHSADLEAHLADRRFELLVNAVTDYALYMLDPEGRIVTWNPGAQRFKGYAADEIVGAHFSRFFTDEDRATDLPTRALRIAAREGRYEAEGWRVRKDGTRFWAHAILDPIRDADGTLLGFAKITRDVTDRREREKALYESEQRFRLLVQGVRDYAIYMLDRDGRVTNWNAGAQAIKGYAEPEIVGHHFSRFYTEADRTGGEPARALEIALREGKYEREAQRVRKDGSLFWAHVLIDPIYDETGAHVGFAKITRDITERKLAEESLRETQQALAQAQKLRALGELTGGIAHDFNNLITVIGGSVDLMRRKPDMAPEQRERHLKAIAETADRATKLTSQLLAFGRRHPLKPEVLDLNLRLDALADMLERTLGSKYALRLDLGADLWRVEADPTGLETAILNAVINARDAMPAGGELTISTRNCEGSQGDAVCVTITDTGEGIPADKLERVFEPFFTTKPVGKGTGLGLSQIHGFTAQSGGRVEIDSTVGEGTTLHLYLPRTDKPLSKGDGAAARATLPEGLDILLVEDSDQVRAFARNLLEDMQCRVVEAADAEHAIDRLRERDFDLVFSDVVMPGASGVELAQQIRAEFAGTPVLLATGYSDQLAHGDCDAFDVLRKPYRSDTVAAAFARVLATRRNAASEPA